MRFFFCFIAIGFALNAIAQDKTSSQVLTLAEAIQRANESSPNLRAARATQEAAEAEAKSAENGLYPKLTIEGNYKKQSVVPKASIGNQTLQLSDDHSYSIGPTLSYVLWDSGITRNRIHALEFLASAKKHQSELSKGQITLATQIAYVQAALASENLLISSKAADLSKVQNKDIAARNRGGSATRLDALNSDSDVLNFQLKIEQSESDLQSNLIDLTYYTGSALDSQTQFENLDHLVRATPISDRASDRSDVVNHPLILAQTELEKSALSQVSRQKSLYWPTITFQARTSLDYPNGPTFEQINQNSLGLNLTWSIFDFGGNKNAVAARLADANAAAMNRKEAQDSILRDREKAEAKVQNLKKQMKNAEALSVKQEQLAKLNYSTFRYGGLRFSDVQTANLRLLESQTRLALLRAQYLVQVFTLQYLSQGASHE